MTTNCELVRIHLGLTSASDAWYRPLSGMYLRLVYTCVCMTFWSVFVTRQTLGFLVVSQWADDCHSRHARGTNILQQGKQVKQQVRLPADNVVAVNTGL